MLEKIIKLYIVASRYLIECCAWFPTVSFIYLVWWGNAGLQTLKLLFWNSLRIDLDHLIPLAIMKLREDSIFVTYEIFLFHASDYFLVKKFIIKVSGSILHLISSRKYSCRLRTENSDRNIDIENFHLKSVTGFILRKDFTNIKK